MTWFSTRRKASVGKRPLSGIPPANETTAPLEGLGGPAVGHPAGERDDRAARGNGRDRARALVVSAQDLRAAREEPGPVERDRRRGGGRARGAGGHRALGDERALPHVGSRPA